MTPRARRDRALRDEVETNFQQHNRHGKAAPGDAMLRLPFFA
jgi:hypothetical protein